MSFLKYPNYKNSGVDWLGKIPNHWHAASLKRGFNVTLGKMLQPESSDKEDEFHPYIRAANIQWTGIDLSDIKRMWFSTTHRKSLRLKVGDLLISEGGEVGRSCLWNNEIEECYFQNSVNRIRSNPHNSCRFLYYWILTAKDKGYIDVLCNKSTIAHFTAEKVAEIPVPYPPLPEQSAIASFLDHETGKIDALIAEQEKLITLLKEKRQATISHAVTKGLNPSAPMKDSGISWLGKVPVHWEVGKIKHWFITQSGGTPNTSKRELYYVLEGGYPWIRSTDLNNDELFETELQISALAVRESACSLIPKDAVLLAMYGGDGTVGKNALLKFESTINQAVCALLPNNFFHAKYTFRYMQYYRPYWMIHAESSRKDPNISQSTILNSPIVHPPIEDQLEIIAFLDDEIEKLDLLTRQVTQAIILLKERRTALISAAVTGKIDVRAYKAPKEVA